MMRKTTETHKMTVYLEEKALKISLAEDVEDYADIEKRKSEPDIPFDEVVAELKKTEFHYSASSNNRE